MVLMALDHTRDFFTELNFAPEDLARTSGPLFFTRFVTHFCAPVFFLLAGTGGYLSLTQGKSLAQVSKFFWSRGLWLVLLDLTVVAFAWTFTFTFWFAGVLWALGWSMVIMAGLVWLPVPVIGALGAAVVIMHNLLDGIDPAALGKFARLWTILHGRGEFAIGSDHDPFFVLFSIIPWVGVMAVGYALGALLRRADWRKVLFGIGAGATISFLILRIFHLYGNSQPDPALLGTSVLGSWKIQSTLTLTIVSFFDTLKYPASLQFLLMTLGPSLMAMAWLGRVKAERGLARILVVFGRVPLSYYVVHLYLIHIVAVVVAWASYQPVAWLLDGATMIQHAPQHYGHGLPFIYGMWITIVVALYLPCKWLMNLKQKHAGWWWLRYI